MDISDHINPTDTKYISLGSTCCISYQLQQLNLRNKAYPFDWIRTKSLKKVIKCLESSFDGFTDLEYLDIKKEFTFQESDDFRLDAVTGIISAKNKYNMTFLHDFAKNNIDDKPKVIDKYNRRIEHFYQTINDQSINIVFVRYDTSYNEKNIFDLIKILDQISKANYKLLVIINTIKSKLIQPNPKLIIKQIDSHTDDWKLDNIDWNILFKI